MRSLALVLALAGCGDAPSCKDAFDKVAKATDTPLAQMGEAAAVCEKERFSGDTRRCIARSTSLDELEQCVEKEPAVTRFETARHEAELRRERAELGAQEAVKNAREAADKVDKIAHDLDELNQKTNTAIDALAAAQSDADRSAAKAKLEELQREAAAARAQVEAAKAAAERVQRAKGVKISKQCLDNPLAAGCN